MTVSVKISALNGTRVVPVDASNEQVTYPTEPTKLAVLRYIPQTEDIWVSVTNEVFVQGDVYESAEELIQFLKFTTECTLDSVNYVNIYAKKTSSGTYLQIGKKIDVSGLLYFALLNSDFAIGDNIDLKVEDYDNVLVYDETTSHIYATLTMTTPVLTAGVEGDITGTSLFVTTVNVYYRLSTDTLWTEFNFGITVIANAWTATGTMPASGTYDFLVTDADYPTVRDQLDDVNVISSVTYYSMAGGYKHSLGIIDGVVYAWGSNAEEQLGNNSVTGSNLPVAVTASGVINGKTIVQVACGRLHSLALDSDGRVYAWGDNASGQLGDNSTTTRDEPVAVDTSGVLNGKTITQIAAGYDYSLALDSDGKLYSWGARGYSSSVPVAVDTSGVLNGKTITSIKVSANAYHAVMLDSDGVVYTMGWNSYGQLGDNSTTDSYTVPVAVDTSGVLYGKTITAIGCGAFNSYAIDSAGKVYSWGKNNRGECGDNTTTTPRMVPVAVYSAGVLFGKTIEFVSGGFSVTVQDSDGKLYSWGDGGLGGALGDGTQIYNQKTPVAVDMTDVLSGKTIVSYSVGLGYVLAVGDDDVFYGWGYNHWGMLGDDTQVQKLVPMIVDISGV